MPNTRHQRNHRHREEDAHNNNQHAPAVVAQPPVAATGQNGVHAAGQHGRRNDNAEARLQKCCTPGSCRFPDEVIDPEDPYDSVKVVCNNEACDEGVWMHKDCFEEFQDSVLSYLRSCGRARSWSEKQRLQNLWTKKGYDLAFKACDCKCGRGHLRKDLDYIPPPINDNSKKHKKHKKKNDKPMPVVSTTHKSNSHSNHVGPTHANGNGNHTATSNASHLNGNANPVHNNPHHVNGNGNVVNSAPQQSNGKQGGRGTSTGQGGKRSAKKATERQRSDDNSTVHRQESLDNQTTTTQSTALPALNDNPHILPHPNNITATNNNYYPAPPGNPQLRLRTNSVSSVGSVGSHSSSISSVPSSAGSVSPVSSSPVSGDMFFKGRKSSDASSSDAGPTSMAGFRQRLDLSAFAALPRNRQNPYHIRMEDTNTLAYAFSSCSLAPSRGNLQWDGGVEEGGCDVETRNFVLTNLLNKRMCSTRCILCKTHLPVFDRFPLIDGTFFLSPQPYDEVAIQVIWEGRLQYLNAACLGCLEGRSNVRCVACKQAWSGRNLVVGSMYTYDIFAASPCCQKRLTCKCCRRAVVDITRGLDFFSQYSQMVICPYCKANDYHFIRSLADTFLVADGDTAMQAPICH